MIDEQTLSLRRLNDFAAKRDKCGRTVFSKFLNLPQQQIPGIKNVALWGGYEDAERKIAAFYPDGEQPCDIAWQLAFVKITLTDGAVLSHRDFLGSLLALGIVRESVGDIVIGGASALVITLPKIDTFICENLVSVAHSHVQCEVLCDISQFDIPQKQYENLRQTVASLRLDCVVAALTSKSRKIAAELISSGRVQINYREITGVDRTVRENDIITIRGFGKFVFDNVSGTSKKGREVVNFRKYI